jgi:transcriptional regulator GlxA family with amidase domain
MNIGVGNLAQTAGLSKWHFARAFKQSVGATPRDYLTRQRLDKALQLLAETNLGLAEIAAESGFADQSHFTKVFSQAHRTPPGAWRRVGAAVGASTSPT